MMTDPNLFSRGIGFCQSIKKFSNIQLTTMFPKVNLVKWGRAYASH